MRAKCFRQIWLHWFENTKQRENDIETLGLGKIETLHCQKSIRVLKSYQRLVSREGWKGPVKPQQISTANFTITELFYTRIFNMNRGSLNTRRIRRIHFSVFKYGWTKNGFTGAKSFWGFRETVPSSQNNVLKKLYSRELIAPEQFGNKSFNENLLRKTKSIVNKITYFENAAILDSMTSPDWHA